MLYAHPLRLTLIGLAVAALTGCGGGPALLDTAAGLDAADRARIVGFETTLPADRLTHMVPAHAPQSFDLRPGSLVTSGLSRYLPILSAELAGSMRRFEDESGVPALEAFERLVFWSDAPTVDALDRSRTELLFAFDGATLVSLIEWLDSGPATGGSSDAPTDETAHSGGMFVAGFSPLDPEQLDAVQAVMDADPQRVQTYVLGPRTRLVTAQGTEGEPAVVWSMWAYSWPGGFIAERSLGNELVVPAHALTRLAGHLRRIDAAARTATANPPPDRVLTARMRGPDPVAIDVDMGQTVGLRVAAPVTLFDLQMPPAVLVASWPVVKLAVIDGVGQALDKSGVGADFGPLVGGLLRASELRVDGDRLEWSTSLPQQAFEALLPLL